MKNIILGLILISASNVLAAQDYYCGNITEISDYSIDHSVTIGGSDLYTPIVKLKYKDKIQYVVIEGGQIKRQSDYRTPERKKLRVLYSATTKTPPQPISEESSILHRLQNLLEMAISNNQHIKLITCLTINENILYIGKGTAILESAQSVQPIRLLDSPAKPAN